MLTSEELIKRITHIENELALLKQDLLSKEPMKRGSDVAEDSIIKDFENAINEAIESQEYYIKHKGYANISVGTLLGVYDMFTYSLIGQRAYDIYKAYATRIHHKPVHRQALYNLLLTKGYLIKPSANETKRTKSLSIKRVAINKKQYLCLVIKKQSLNLKHN